MKFVERSNGLYLEDIERDDIRFSNLAGRLTGSMYDNPDRPSHVMVFWIRDDNLELVEALKAVGVKVKEKSEYDITMDSKSESQYIKDLQAQLMGNKRMAAEYQNKMRYSVQFKAYPKMRENRSGTQEQYPKVMMKTTKNTVQLSAGSFGLIDSANIQGMSVRFHLWQWDPKHPENVVAVLDEIWAVCDEGAGEIDESYLAEKYGYSPDSVSDDEEVPFM